MKAFLSSKFYFVFCLGVGLCSWWLTLGEASEKTTGSAQLSSYREVAASSPYSARLNAFEASLNNIEIQQRFTVSAAEFNSNGNESLRILSYADQENFQNNLDQLIETINEPTSIADYNGYDDISSCTEDGVQELLSGAVSASVLAAKETTNPLVNIPQTRQQALQSPDMIQLAQVDHALNTTASIADLIQERSSSPTQMARGCMMYVMKGMRKLLKRRSFALCASGANVAPMRGGPRVCLTKALVNSTYNSYMDVAECLGLNPANILPKLANESGFLLNTYGGGSDAGVGQLTRPAIDDVNQNYANYLKQMTAQAKTNPACARIMKHKDLLTMVPKDISFRCNLITAPENPLKNIVYMGILNKLNINSVKRAFAKSNTVGKLQQLGLSNVNIDQLIEAIAMAGYNSGANTSTRILNSYLDKRLAANLPLTADDFDFHGTATKKVYDELIQSETDVITLARSYVMAVIMKPEDTPDVTSIKVKRVALLPRKIKESYRLTFPEFIVYNQNNFDGVSDVIDAKFANIGSPGYLTFLALNDIRIKKEFAGQSGNCSNPEFFKIK